MGGLSVAGALRAAAIPVVVAYPFLLRALLEHASPRLAAATVLLGLTLSFSVRRALGHESFRTLAAQHALAGGAALLALAQGRGLALLLIPCLVSLGLFAVFAATLWQGPPLIERVARRVSGAGFLEEMVPHCRQATVAWCVFFLANAVAVAGLAVKAPLAWWTFYTGILAYALMAALFAGEYAVRSVRKRRLASLRGAAATSR
jgi:uncharacterized membrane protein